jgi:predicted esterase
MTRTSSIPAFAACVFLAACSKNNGGGGSADAGPGVGVGEDCKSARCRDGLFCDSASKTCAPGGNIIQGGSCDLTASCNTGNFCTQLGVCAASGTGALGAGCSSEGDCQSGLVCAQSGLTGVCKTAGTNDLGHSCADTSECMAGLLCINGLCGKAGLNTWAGATCPAEDSVAKIYFHVPRATDQPGNDDFYRLPFPNDIRMKNGRVDVSGHPHPGPRILPFDLVARTMDAIQTDSTGFGANETIYLRLSKAFNAGLFPGDCGAQFLDITPTSPTYTHAVAFHCAATTASSRYLCGPAMWVRPDLGSPLRPGTTYAVVLRKTITDTTGAVFGPDDDFTAMLAATLPADADLALAYPAYQPLRDYIATGAIAATDLASAAVFTVDKYEDPLAAIDKAVATAPTPKIENWVRCGDPGVVSPCDDNKTGTAHVRGCLGVDSTTASFDTYQGTIALPLFQQGTPPYLAPSDGGNIQYAADGSAVINADTANKNEAWRKVCFALTVPKGTAPATGWPLVVYAHGTGGSYHSFIDLGLADDFAQGTAPVFANADGGASAAAVPMAVLGYDGVLHGTRNNGSTTSVGELVYNFLNPPAARDNALQAAADLLAIPTALPGLVAQPVLAAKGIALDATKLALYGHSQGGNGASLVAARQSKYGAIIMSGTGGTLAYTLIGKTQPVNIPAVLPYLLGEPGAMTVDQNHPVINLMQMYFERSDSVNFGRRLFQEPLPTMTAHHILHVYGTSDSYSVVPTQQAYALASAFQVAPNPPVDNFGLLPVKVLPAHNNEFFGSYGSLTALEVQYAPAPPPNTYDGHFVSTQNPAAHAAIQEMLVTFARDGVPSVSP